MLVFTNSKDDLRRAALSGAGAEVVRMESDSPRVDLHAVLKQLATRGCNEVLVEAGPSLSGRLIELGLANELLIYMAPVVLGADARSMFSTHTLEAMAARWNFQVHDVGRSGPDIRLRFRRTAEPTTEGK